MVRMESPSERVTKDNLQLRDRISRLNAGTIRCRNKAYLDTVNRDVPCSNISCEAT